jgi:Ala-tRNA(Pro) deacylase
MDTSEKVYKTLDDLSIEYEKHEHPPVFTVEEANAHWSDIKGKHSKNLFLRNKKGNRHFLVVMDAEKSLDIKQFQNKIGISNLSFASEKRLDKYLGLTKGSVSPFGLINDENHDVEVIVDKDLVQADFVNFHPNVNTATLTISAADFKQFLEQMGNKVSYHQFQ